MIKRYKKKPVEIEAVQWNGLNLSEVSKFVGNDFIYKEKSEHNEKLDSLDLNLYIGIHTLEGDMEISLWDYVIKGINGEFYPCKPDIFEKTYDEIDEHPSPCKKCSMKSNGACCGCPEYTEWKKKYGDKNKLF